MRVAGPRTVGEFLPDCNVGPSGAGSGICVGIQGGDCEALATPVDQGTCHGVQGDDCRKIPISPFDFVGAEKASSRNTPLRNISADMPLLYCARTDVPPSFWIRDDVDLQGNPITTPNRVESHIRLNDLGIAVVVDRQSDGIDGALPAASDCTETGADPTGDCLFAGTCLDLNFATDVLLENGDGESILNLEVLGAQRLERRAGAVCQVGVDLGDDIPFVDQSPFDAVIDGVIAEFDKRVPDLVQPEGIPLPLVSPQLIAVRTSEAQEGFDDYLGLSTATPGPEDTCGNGTCDTGETCGLRGPDACLQNCGLCKLGEACENRIDCDTGICIANLCVSPDAEFQPADCDAGCLFDSDCLTGVCNFGFCTGLYSQPALRPCSTDRACRSKNCRAGLCEAVCGDGFCDGAEVCGGDNGLFECRSDCGRCPNGSACIENSTCQSGICSLGTCRDCRAVGSRCDADGECCSGNCGITGLCSVLP
ncbi:MAG: hypothetical protein JSV80_12430 [Acidobacteriota bacterium]|nr:MAG: hypothetical protein JSV80_12430 [Acidobacteriota bacterium]